MWCAGWHLKSGARVVTDIVRRWLSRLLVPIARFLSKHGFAPNTVTVLGCVLTAAVALVLAGGRQRLAGALLTLTLGVDAVDGTLARVTGQTTRFGAFLDSTLDRWAEVFIFGALVWYYLKAHQDLAVMLATAAMAFSLLVSYTRARAEGVGLKCNEGVLSRFERLAVLIAGLILQQLVAALWIICALAAFTALQRIWVTWQSDHYTQS